MSWLRVLLANVHGAHVGFSLGSVFSTIGLTVPSILVVSRLTNHPVMLGLQHSDLRLTLCLVIFASGRMTVLQGAVHLIFLRLIFFCFDIRLAQHEAP
jgi:Ca2+:H+ antiporter